MPGPGLRGASHWQDGFYEIAVLCFVVDQMYSRSLWISLREDNKLCVMTTGSLTGEFNPCAVVGRHTCLL